MMTCSTNHEFYENVQLERAEGDAAMSDEEQFPGDIPEVVLRVLAQHNIGQCLASCAGCLHNVSLITRFICFRIQSLSMSDHTTIHIFRKMRSKNKCEICWSRESSNAVKRFLGLTGCYHRFISQYATIAALLTDLLKKDSFEWSEAATEAFVSLGRPPTRE